jgi:hypothetical protein
MPTEGFKLMNVNWFQIGDHFLLAFLLIQLCSNCSRNGALTYRYITAGLARLYLPIYNY